MYFNINQIETDFTEESKKQLDKIKTPANAPQDNKIKTPGNAPQDNGIFSKLYVRFAPGFMDGFLATLNVYSWFNNFPVHPAIDIIIEHVYHRSYLAPPSKLFLKQLLEICTTKKTFQCVSGNA